MNSKKHVTNKLGLLSDWNFPDWPEETLQPAREPRIIFHSPDFIKNLYKYLNVSANFVSLCLKLALEKPYCGGVFFSI